MTSTATNEAIERTSGELAQLRLLAALARPGGGAPVDVIALEMAGGAIRTGAIFGADGARLGKIENFQIDFMRPGEGETLDALRRQFISGALPRPIGDVPEWRTVSHDSGQIDYAMPRIPVADPTMVALDLPGGTVSFEGRGQIEVLLFAHPWSGIVEVKHGGETIVLDLYVPHTDLPRPLKLDLGATPQRVEIVLTGRRNPLSGGHQCLFGGFRELTGRLVPLRHIKQPRVRGAQFVPAFHDLLNTTPANGLLLDVGGGNRQFDDPRYINLDYEDYDDPDLVGDATLLPLRDSTVDAVYSTGVFEHIRNPAQAGAEVARVLKPGGRAVICWAFMQPIHSEGQHFYNATPWGVEQAFAGLKLKRMWFDTSFAYLVRWGASVSGLTGRVPKEEIDAVFETLRQWDAKIPYTHKQYMANGIWAEFDKV